MNIKFQYTKKMLEDNEKLGGRKNIFDYVCFKCKIEVKEPYCWYSCQFCKECFSKLERLVKEQNKPINEFLKEAYEYRDKKILESAEKSNHHYI
jgi:hypothetical protein